MGLRVMIEDGPLRSVPSVPSLNRGPSKTNVGILGRCTILPRTFKLVYYIGLVFGLRSWGFTVLHDQGGGLCWLIVYNKVDGVVISTFHSSLYDVSHHHKGSGIRPCWSNFLLMALLLLCVT